MKRLYGVDGCRGGWVVAEAPAVLRRIHFSLMDNLSLLFAKAARGGLIAIDIPIGLPITEPRMCDREARKLLGWPRRSSVFSPSARQAFGAASFRGALRINRRVLRTGISIQAFHILAKIRQVDVLMNRDRQRYIREVHPEVTFAQLNRRPMRHYKKTPAGRAERLRVLNSAGLSVSEEWLIEERSRLNRAHVALDDLVDALACLVTAFHIDAGRCRVLGRYQRDAKQLLMEIVTCAMSEEGSAIG